MRPWSNSWKEVEENDRRKAGETLPCLWEFYWSGMFQFVSCRTCQRHPVLKIRIRNSSLVAGIAWTAHVVNYDMPLKYYDSVYYDVRIIWLANPASHAFDTQKIYWDARRLFAFSPPSQYVARCYDDSFESVSVLINQHSLKQAMRRTFRGSWSCQIAT